MNGINTSHGSPYDRGSADRYYGRVRSPHYWIPCGLNGRLVGVKESEMTPAEIEEYNRGYDEENDRKLWD